MQGTELTSDKKATCINVIFTALIEEDMLFGWMMIDVLALSPDGLPIHEISGKYCFWNNC